ncbi:Phospholipase/carboxylesterase/thioesterase [Mycena rebaudengoi]|nr:Phospholipase/carboxylesterase/thioesterase [Mycena rebaudengoi]
MLPQKLIPGLLSAYFLMAPTAKAPQYLRIAANSKHSATVILMHGLGDSGRGMYPTANMFHQDPAFSHVSWILPHAPVRPIRANGNHKMPAWFDVYNFQFEGEEDEAGMLESIASVDQLITEEVESGIDPGRIVLAGFTQGGAMTLLTGLTTPKKLAGLAILSGRLPISHKIKDMASPHASSYPIFWGHGIADPLAKFIFGRVSADFLMQEMKVPAAPATGEAQGLEFHGYEGLGTGMSQEELRDLGVWLKKVLPAEK